jgi:hypoxanthine phosphoribosyltransferase
MTASTYEIPPHFHPLYSATQIQQAVGRLGKEISVWAAGVWKNSHTDILTVPVLRGGIFFYTDLVRQIDLSVELVPTTSRGYEDSANNVQRSELTVDLAQIPARGRSILLIDDICDSGRTLAVMSTRLRDAGADDVRAAVLVSRAISKPACKPQWIGFEYAGPEWLVGYGMDDCNRYRNLDSIYIIRNGNGSKQPR